MDTVSLGSGNGKLEQQLEEYTNRKIICIEPDESYPNFYKRPEFSSMTQYLQSRKTLNSIFMIIDWPAPNNMGVMLMRF